MSYNCLAFRREKLADPKRISGEARQHLAQCAHCQSFARRVDHMETRISEGLAVAIPDGLAERVILRAASGRPLSWRPMALAASVIVSFLLGAWWLRGATDVGGSPAHFAIAHVLHEPEALSDVRANDPAQFKAILASFGGDMQAPIGKLRFIKLCPSPDGKIGWHIVFETEHGLATLFLMPDAGEMAVDTANIKGFTALARPAGKGYYAVVTDSAESLQSADEALRTKIRWRT